MNRSSGKHASMQGNILLVANWESNVGYAWWLMENFWTQIASRFKPRGARSFLVYPKITKIPDPIAATDIAVSELAFDDHRPANLLRICRFIKKHDIRYVYLSDWPSYSFFYLLLRLCGVRKIAVHDHTPGDRTVASGLKKHIKSMIQRLPWITADLSIAVTDFVHQRHLQVNCIPARKCRIARNGIFPLDDKTFEPGYAQTAFSLPQDARLVVSTGRASNYKGVDFMIECANELINHRKTDKLYFLFCGDGPDMPAFIALRDRYQLTDKFILAGRRSDIRRLLPSCTIGFHASHGEVGYSLSILEYMSAGLATLVPDRPSTCQATQHGINGLVYRHDDVNAACDEIQRCLEDDLQKQLGPVARKDVAENYHIEQTNRMLIDALTPVFAPEKTQ